MKKYNSKPLEDIRKEEKEKQDKAQAVENMQNDMATIVFESMQDKVKIEQLEMDLGNALLEIMELKLGGNQ